MRYYLNSEAQPEPVRFIVTEGMCIVNPTDEQVDEAGAGYPLEDTPQPEFNPETQTMDSCWEVQDGVITRVWTVEDIPEAELAARAKSAEIAAIQREMAALNAGFEAFKSTPQTFTNGKSYLPRWVPEFYTPLLALGESVFPQSISACDGSTSIFTFAEFQSLFSFLITISGTETARVNALLLDLQTRLATLTEAQ